jgi:hypothetical protein
VTSPQRRLTLEPKWLRTLLEFTGNDLLDNVMNKVVVTLSRLVKHAKKVILSNVVVNDAAFELEKTELQES